MHDLHAIAEVGPDTPPRAGSEVGRIVVEPRGNRAKGTDERRKVTIVVIALCQQKDIWPMVGRPSVFQRPAEEHTVGVGVEAGTRPVEIHRIPRRRQAYEADQAEVGQLDVQQAGVQRVVQREP